MISGYANGRTKRPSFMLSCLFFPLLSLSVQQLSEDAASTGFGQCRLRC